jgi:hypothetical protein
MKQAKATMYSDTNKIEKAYIKDGHGIVKYEVDTSDG